MKINWRVTNEVLEEIEKGKVSVLLRIDKTSEAGLIIKKLRKEFGKKWDCAYIFSFISADIDKDQLKFIVDNCPEIISVSKNRKVYPA